MILEERNNAQWRLFEWFMLRATGFPFSWLVSDSTDCKGSSKTQSPSTESLDNARERLWELTAAPHFREALLLSSPVLEANLDHYRCEALADRTRRSTTRKRERTVLRYAQRVAVKNDTTSIFGAAASGRLGVESAIDDTLPTHRSRRAFSTQWVIQELLVQAQRELAQTGAFTEFPRRGCGLSLDDAGVNETKISFESGKPELHRRRYGQLEKLALELSDGETPMESLVDELARAGDLSSPEAEALLLSLVDKGLLLSVSALPTGLCDPLGFARDLLLRQPESEGRARWLERLSSLERSLETFPELELPEKKQSLQQLEREVAQWTGAKPRRRPGQYNASRLIVHETADRVGEAMGLPVEWERSLRNEMGPYLEIGFALASLSRSRFRDWFSQRIGPSDEGSLWSDVWLKMQRDQSVRPSGTTIELARALETLRGHLRGLVDEHIERRGAAVPLELDASIVHEILGDVADELDAGSGYANPDVAIAGAGLQGDPTLVLAEAHHLPMHSGQLLAGLTCADEINDATRQLLGSLCGGRYALPVYEQLSFTSVTLDVGQVALEISGSSPLPLHRRVSFFELRAHLSEGSFRFTAPSYSGQVIELVPLTRFAHLDLASRVFPVPAFELCEWLCDGVWREISELPRIGLGRLVLHRRLWQVPSEVLTSEPNSDEAFRALDEHCGEGLPRFLFLWAEGEPKPVFLDLNNPLFREMTLWLAGRNPLLELVEMLPAPQDLWLKSEQGLHTSELRLIFFRNNTG